VTLGPPGTTSEEAAETFGAVLQREFGVEPAVRLKDSFEEAVARVLDGLDLAVLVPSAYGGVAPFYMHPRLELAAVFVRRTPEYGVAERPNEPVPLTVRVVAHPATYCLVDYLLPASCRAAEVVGVSSTSRAAQLVASREADLAVTNQPSAERHGLRLCPGPTFAFDMTWSVFISREGNPHPAVAAP
jgi:prephenate dehydratase